MVSIKRSETAQRSTLEIRDKFSLIQNAVEDKIQSKNFFPTEFCLRLYLSQTEFCLRLNLPRTEFVSDYITQLYFVCNLLIAVCIYRYVITFGLRSKYDVLGHYFIFMIVLSSINKFNMMSHQFNMT